MAFPAVPIELLETTVRDLVEGYQDDGDGGARGYGGRLDIRPPINASSFTRTVNATP